MQLTEYNKKNSGKTGGNPVISAAGFTLLETMVAVSIIAIVLVSIYKLHIQTISMNITAKFYATAPFLAQEKISELELSPLSDMSDDAGDFGDEFPGYTWNLSVEDIETDLMGDITSDIKKIDVAVAFNNDEFNYKLRTYRFIRE